MQGRLEGKRVAILATDGFEEAELLEPWKALREAGAAVDIVSLKAGDIRGYRHDQPGTLVAATVEVASAEADDYDGLVLPGGVRSPDVLRMDRSAVNFVKDFVDAAKPIAAICHGPWTLIEAGGVKGRRLTSWPSLRTDLRNAGAEWVNEEVVVDEGLVTSRKPADLPAFNRKMVEEIAEGRHRRGRSPRRSVGRETGGPVQHH